MPAKMSLVNIPARMLVVSRLAVAPGIRDLLTRGRYSVHTATSIPEATVALDTWLPHLVVIDLDLVPVYEIPQWRAAHPAFARTPVVVLTRHRDLATTLEAFDLGVDDVLTIPFHGQELVARIQAVLRRTYHDVVAFTPALRIGDLEINIHDRVVRIGGHGVHLTTMEQNLLYLLAANSDHHLTRGEILDALWGPDYVADSNVVDRHIRNLRVKLHDDPHRPRYIVTVPGTGYRFRRVSTDQVHDRRRPELAAPRETALDQYQSA